MGTDLPEKIKSLRGRRLGACTVSALNTACMYVLLGMYVCVCVFVCLEACVCIVCADTVCI
ncbi:hypothetical protein EON63_11920 [archaeon]|nr:MAG: hypothetical protein EON63_11920 [archaeon]